MARRPQYSIIIPVYNEAKRLAPALRQLDVFLGSLDVSWELLVVNDGSSDSTLKILERHQEVIPMHIISLEKNQGKGGAVRAGMLAATGQYRAFLDIDLATPPQELLKLFSQLKNGADVAIGSRITADGVDQRLTGKKPQSFGRRVLGKLFRMVATKPFLGDIRDSQCGAKAFTSNAAEILFPLQQITRWSFDIEILFLAKKMNLQIVEVPVEWSAQDDSKLKPSVKMAFDVIRELLTITWIHRDTGRGY